MIKAVVGFILITLAMSPVAAPLRDPTTPLNQSLSSVVGEKKHNSALVLQAVFSRPEGRTAIISGKSLRQGESIGAWRVVSLVAQGVTLERNGKRKTLLLRSKISP